MNTASDNRKFIYNDIVGPVGEGVKLREEIGASGYRAPHIVEARGLGRESELGCEV